MTDTGGFLAPIKIPAEWEPHSCCWMAWAVHSEWANTIKQVKGELASIIQTISEYEPVRLLTPKSELVDASTRFSGGKVEIIEAPVDDIWLRDIAPTFAWRHKADEQELVAIDWNFSGWGGTGQRLPRVGDHLAERAATIFGVPRIQFPFVAEGGALVTDGQGTLVTTRSCLLNPNRNAVHGSVDRQRLIELEFHKLGLLQVIWLEGDPCEPITNGHADGYVLFAPDGLVLIEDYEDKEVESPLWREHDIALLRSASDLSGRKLKVKTVKAPRFQYWRYKTETFAPCYLNSYVTNGAVISARFGDNERDEIAEETLKQAFPGRKILMLLINNIASGGGGIHCLTQPVPAKR